ncbi:zinc finger, CCHC-type containing protein [Tanacetum coccineum]
MTHHIYYGETFSPVADIRAIRILLAIAAFYDYEIWQMDVKYAFLNVHLSEDLYMVQPEGFVDPKNPSKVCKLQRSIYGLKQASRSWDKRFYKEIKKKFKIDNSKHGSVPMQEKPNYRNRPDVAFAQNLCSRFQHNPSKVHLTSVKTILKYLRNTKDMVLVYRGRPEIKLKVTCYADAGFQTDKDDTKSQSVYVFVLNGYGMPLNKRPMDMLCDNAPAIVIANDLRIMKGARDYQRKYHYIREVIPPGAIVLKKVHTDDNLADPFQSQCHITSILNMLWELMYGYIKNHKKTVKNGQARTRESEEYKRSQRFKAKPEKSEPPFNPVKHGQQKVNQ